MTEHQTLDSYLSDYAGDDELRLAVAQTVQSIANACCASTESGAFPSSTRLAATSASSCSR